MMKKLLENKKFKYTLLVIIAVCIICLGITYAYWLLTKQQVGSNVVTTACLKVDFSGENDIKLDKAYPMNEEQLESFLSSATPYHFTIKNECDNLGSVSINLESLTVSGKALEDEYIDVILYEDDYNINLNRYKKLTRNTPNDENKVITDAKHAYSLYKFTLKQNEEKDFNLLLYMDPETPMEDANMNASWKGKITLSSEYTNNKFINAGTLKTISYNDEEGMWKYKSNIKQIVIEDSKNLKTSEDGVLYGPFDESAKQDNSIQSYVVCEEEDTSCIGYLQGDGGVKLNQNSSNLFNGFTNVTDITGLENLDTSEAVSMMNMFSGMSSLLSIDLSNFNTSNVTNMASMFNFCQSLTELDLSSFDVSNVSTVGSMFNSDTSLTTLNLSNWKFNNNIAKSFTGQSSLNTCTSLENLILTNVNTSEVTDMGSMFVVLSSPKLTNLDLSDFDTTNVVNMSSMFGGSYNLQTIDLSSFDTSNVTNISSMFGGCAKLTTLDLSGFNTEMISNVTNLFENASGLTELNLSGWNLSGLTSAPNMFKNNTSLKTLNMTNVIFPPDSTDLFSGNLTSLNNLILDGVNTSNTTKMFEMFKDCTSITNLDLSNFDTSHVSNIALMFKNMTSLQSLDLSNWVFNDSLTASFSLVTSLGNTSSEVEIPLKTIILKNVNTANVTTVKSMFSSLHSLESLDLSDFDTDNLVNMDGMIFGSSKLQSLNLSNWNFNKVTVGFGGSSNAFGPGAPSSLQTIILNNVKTDEVTDMTNLFLGLKNLQSLDLSSFDTSNVTNMSSMFNGCSGLTSLDLSMFDTTKLTGTIAMFNNMNSLQELNLSNWKFNDNIAKSFAANSGLSYDANFNSLILENVNTSNVTNMDSMFMSLPVTTLDVSSFDTSHVTNMRVMFGFMNNLQSLNISSFNTNLVTDMSAMFITDSKLTEINYGSNFVHNPLVVIDSMFNGTNAPRPPHSSWQDVSFD